MKRDLQKELEEMKKRSGILIKEVDSTKLETNKFMADIVLESWKVKFENLLTNIDFLINTVTTILSISAAAWVGLQAVSSLKLNYTYYGWLIFGIFIVWVILIGIRTWAVDKYSKDIEKAYDKLIKDGINFYGKKILSHEAKLTTLIKETKSLEKLNKKK